MRVMLVGGGGREHALAWKIAQSAQLTHLVCAPGNAGMAAEPETTCHPVGAGDVDGLVRLAADERIDLVMVGPEAPLCDGLADRLRDAGVAVVGPGAAAARLEGSKVFAKRLMERVGVPTAAFQVFDDAQAAKDFVRANPRPWVLKADGLAAGKGVLMCADTAAAEAGIDQILVERAFGDAGDRLLIEETLEGEEASCIALVSGRDLVLLASSQDHKRALDGDRGLNTGGMGAYSPAPVMDEALDRQVVERVFRPIVDGLAADGIDYRGILYAGLMIGPEGPQVLEFNVRFGDPETQALLPRISSDLLPALAAVARGELAGLELTWDPRPAVCVVMASGGYPGSYEKGKPIDGLDAASKLDDVVVIHAGTRAEGDRVLTAGGRVLDVCALGADIQGAVAQAYRAVDAISFDGAHYRTDIAHRALARIQEV